MISNWTPLIPQHASDRVRISINFYLRFALLSPFRGQHNFHLWAFARKYLIHMLPASDHNVMQYVRAEEAFLEWKMCALGTKENFSQLWRGRDSNVPHFFTFLHSPRQWYFCSHFMNQLHTTMALTTCCTFHHHDFNYSLAASFSTGEERGTKKFCKFCRSKF